MLNNSKKIFCVDIGGTKTTIAIFDETGKEYWEYDEIEELDIKILSWSDPQPIENTFK